MVTYWFSGMRKEILKNAANLFRLECFIECFHEIITLLQPGEPAPPSVWVDNLIFGNALSSQGAWQRFLCIKHQIDLKRTM